MVYHVLNANCQGKHVMDKYMLSYEEYVWLGLLLWWEHNISDPHSDPNTGSQT